MKHNSKEQLFRSWAQQLHREFEDICWRYKVHLRAPIIEISPSKKVFGSWKADIRTLSISSYLIKNYSWEVTLNVFKHELAHQICSEIFNSKEMSHGESFQHACDIFGLPKPFRKARGDFPKHLASMSEKTTLSTTGKRFLTKVEKLLALAQSANEHEATLAMQKANELIARYNLECLEKGGSSRYTFVIINKKKKRIETYQRRICSLLIDFFHVKVVTSSLYDPQTDQSHKTIELLGTIENVAIAEYCFHFLENQLALLWQNNRHRFTGKTRTEKYSYYLGVLKGFNDKLSEQSLRVNGVKMPAPTPHREGEDIHSLVKVEDKKLAEYVQMRFPRLRKISRHGPRIYPGTYSEGVTSGKTLTLKKGISEKDQNKIKLLLSN